MIDLLTSYHILQHLTTSYHCNMWITFPLSFVCVAFHIHTQKNPQGAIVLDSVLFARSARSLLRHEVFLFCICFSLLVYSFQSWGSHSTLFINEFDIGVYLLIKNGFLQMGSLIIYPSPLKSK